MPTIDWSKPIILNNANKQKCRLICSDSNQESMYSKEFKYVVLYTDIDYGSERAIFVNSEGEDINGNYVLINA